MYPIDTTIMSSTAFHMGSGTGVSREVRRKDDVKVKGCSEIPSVDDLTDWTQSEHDLDTRAALKLGFGLADLSLSANQRLFIREFARSALCTGVDGKQYKYGAAVRLLVRVNDFSTSGKLNLPAVAAETQMGRMQAESFLRILGYKGQKLAGMLPPFRTFNVDAYVEMSTKMNDIKKLIGEDTGNIDPVLLGVDAGPDEIGIDLNEAIGFVWGFTQISKGLSCKEAKKRYPDQGSHISIRAIENAYSRIHGHSDCGSTKPTKFQRMQAKDLIQGMVLK